jgi:hypothetical protein
MSRGDPNLGSGETIKNFQLDTLLGWTNWGSAYKVDEVNRGAAVELIECVLPKEKQHKGIPDPRPRGVEKGVHKEMTPDLG